MLKNSLCYILLPAFMWSCKKGADTPAEASQRLLAAREWRIHEILVNDAVTFSDGKMKKQFGGVDLERYMESARFDKAGNFTGIMKGSTEPTRLRWRINSPDILVTASDTSAKESAWTITSGDVEEDVFSMKTQSTAYDYPRMTKVELRFKSVP